MKLFVTGRQEFENNAPESGFIEHYVYPRVDIQGIFWICIVENSVDNVKNSGISGVFPGPPGPEGSLCNEYSSAEVDIPLCCRRAVDAIMELW